MPQFKHLNVLLQHTDKAFQRFYDTMLNEPRMKFFFSSQEQINSLIRKQQEHFENSLSMGRDQLKKSYIWLGKLHYDLRIPYVDFMKGTEILEEYFLLQTQGLEPASGLLNEILLYFKIMKSFTAKGYLHRMLRDDKRDLDEFFEQINQSDESYLPKDVIFKKLYWLRELLEIIESNHEVSFMDPDEFFQDWKSQLQFIAPDKRAFFEGIEKRIVLNTRNLFYFLQKEEYLEILPLYTSLLSVYKLVLMMNSAITIEYAHKALEDMRVDGLTQLYRRELFEELMKKEIALLQRDESYHFSLVLMDLDDFKGINDNFGHYSGDKVLEKLGELIRANIRASDLAFRLGGDEFAIVLKHAKQKQASVVCEKIQKELRQTFFVFNDQTTFSASLSIGIRGCDSSNASDFSAVYQNTDNTLFEAKRLGKNQIVMNASVTQSDGEGVTTDRQ